MCYFTYMAQIPVTPYIPTTGAGNGEAFILQGGMGSLGILREQDAIARRVREREAQAQQKREAQQLQDLQKVRLGLSDGGFLPYQPELETRKQAVFDEMVKVQMDPKLPDYQKKVGTEKILADYNSKATWTKQVENRFKEVTQLSGRDKRYNPAAVDKLLYSSLNDTNGNRLPIAGFNPDVLNTVLENPDTFDKTAVAAAFLDELAKADTSSESTAATPGRFGERNTATSNYWEVENGALKLDPVTGNRIPRINRPEVIEAARRDPFVSKLIDQQMQAHAATVQTVVEKMRNLEPLTADEQQLVEQEQTEPKRYASYLNELLLPHAYQRTSEIQTYARPLAPKAAPRPKAAPKPSATEVTATPTVGYQASTFQPAATGSYGQMKQALGIAPPLVTNHYPTVGETFASARRPYADVTIDNRQAEVVGQDGKTTTRALGNGKVPMQIVSRDLVLYSNGKRLGRKAAYQSDAEAYEDLLRTINELTPEQARKAELRAEYRGTLTDKARTTNDGAGSQGRTTAGQEADIAKLIAEAAGDEKSTVNETRLSVIVPASQATDAQLRQATGGKWNPQQPTPQQARAIEALTRRGGRIVTPYGTTATPATPAPLIGSGDRFRRGSKLVGSNDALGFGAGGPLRSSGVDWGDTPTLTKPKSTIDRRGGAY